MYEVLLCTGLWTLFPWYSIISYRLPSVLACQDGGVTWLPELYLNQRWILICTFDTCTCSQTHDVSHPSCHRWFLEFAEQVSSSFPLAVWGRLLLSCSDRSSLQQMPNTTTEFWLPVCRAAKEHCPKPIKHTVQSQHVQFTFNLKRKR